jgi:hypothetical protein
MEPMGTLWTEAEGWAGVHPLAVVVHLLRHLIQGSGSAYLIELCEVTTGFQDLES